MSKLTKTEAKAHGEALLILEKDVLSWDDKMFVLEHWQESANHVNSIAGAFFTLFGLARDFSLDVHGPRVLDLCAGIGTLSLAVYEPGWELVCVELNPAYVEIGKKIVPEAQWIEASIFDLPDLGRFDSVISNPPFGNVDRGGGSGPRYTGAKFEFHVMDIAASLGDWGTFIVPQASSGFRYSGAHYFDRVEEREYLKFSKQTGVTLDIGVGVDTSYYDEDWHGVSPRVEIACVDFRDTELVSVVTEAESQLTFDFGDAS